MICFLTSRTDLPGTGELNPANRFTDELRRCFPDPCRALYICSDPDGWETMDFYASVIRGTAAAAELSSPFLHSAMFHREKRIGSVPAIPSSSIGHSRIGLGFEKLDRGVFDPEKAYDKVAALGVKWIRVQSGWARTEQTRGVYDWGWLDAIVDSLRSRGLVPWVCLCYGNALYDAEAATRFWGLGCPPVATPEQLSAWKAYVTATVRHFAGRVTWWEVWNEPDCEYAWRFKCDPLEYATLCRETAAAIREGDPRARVIGGSFAFARIDFVGPLLQAGFAEWCDAVTYHVYSSDETYDNERVENLRAMLARHRPGGLPVIQGEGGCQSSPDGCGALSGQMLTPLKQASSLARHFVSQLAQDLMFVSFFSCMDMAEAQNGKVGEGYRDFGYFGVLGADFDRNGVATIMITTDSSVPRQDANTPPNSALPPLPCLASG